MYTPVLSEKLKFWTLSHHCHCQLASGPHTLDSTAPISGDRSFNTVCRKIPQFSETTSVSIKITSRASFITSFHFFDYLSLVTHTVLTWSLNSATTEIVFEGLSKQESNNGIDRKPNNFVVKTMEAKMTLTVSLFRATSTSTSKELPAPSVGRQKKVLARFASVFLGARPLSFALFIKFGQFDPLAYLTFVIILQHFSGLENKKKVPKNEDAKKGIMYHFGQTTTPPPTQPVKSISSFIIVSLKKWQVFLCPQPEVYSSRTGYMPEAPKCIQPKFPKL